MSLPSDFVVRLSERTAVVDSGEGLIGGSPTRYIRLSASAHEHLIDREVSAATPVGAALANKLLELTMADPVIEKLPEVPAEYTIVIPVMDRPQQLDRLLASIRESVLGYLPRVIVVDDASANPSAIVAVAKKWDAECLELTTNVGPGGARNAGLAQVETEFVVFLDSDLVIDENTIPTLLKHFADPHVAMAVPRVLGLGQSSNWISQYENARSSLDLGPVASAVKPRSTLAWASSAAVVARVSALGDGFDPGMRVGEDVDLVWRLSQQGWRIRYEPAAQVFHEHRVTLRSWLRRKAEYGSGAVPLAERHPDLIAPAIMAPWTIGVVLSLIAQRKWSVPVALAFAASAAYRSSEQLGSAHNPTQLGVELTAKGLGSAITQTTALMLKHWWPVTVIGCLFSRRIRTATLTAVVIDTVVEYEKSPTDLDPVHFGVARRMDDMAYGAGVWLASIKARNFRALRPEISRPSEGSERQRIPG